MWGADLDLKCFPLKVSLSRQATRGMFYSTFPLYSDSHLFLFSDTASHIAFSHLFIIKSCEKPHLMFKNRAGGLFQLHISIRSLWIGKCGPVQRKSDQVKHAIFFFKSVYLVFCLCLFYSTRVNVSLM